MPIASADVRFRKPLTVNDTAANGGKMTYTSITSGVRGNLFPDVRNSERVAGITRWRKVFVAFEPSDTLSRCYEVQIALWKPTPAGDYVTIHPGTPTDTQGDVSSSPPRAYGAATLAAGVVSTDTSLDVTLEADLPIFQAGDLILVTTKTTVGGTTGTEAKARISAVSGTGTSRTLTLSGPIGETFTAGARVLSIYEAGDRNPTISNTSVSSTSGTFDDSKVQAHINGAVWETITLTFTSSTSYTAVGSVSGSLGTFYTYSSASIYKDSKQMLTIPSDAFGGTFAVNDTVTFNVNAGAVPLWIKQVVPANTPIFTNNEISLAVELETV